MASIRAARLDQLVCYAILDQTGRKMYVEANKSAASRKLNRLTKSGQDTKGWTIVVNVRTPISNV